MGHRVPCRRSGSTRIISCTTSTPTSSAWTVDVGYGIMRVTRDEPVGAVDDRQSRLQLAPWGRCSSGVSSLHHLESAKIRKKEKSLG